MPYYFFIWTPEIVDHLAEHDVDPEEFEYVVNNPESMDRSRSTGNPVAFGWTPSGKYLCCVFERIDTDTIEPVTAYEVKD
jgi:hypothetical protein